MTLNDAALALSLTSVVLCLYRSPRLSMAFSVAAMFYSLWGARIERWRHDQGD